jgi:hypothetical protein
MRERGACDANWDGSSEIGSSEFRCRPDLVCQGPYLPNGKWIVGQCMKR